MSEKHYYVSTACQHGLHGQCRERCKFCDAKCECTQCSHSVLAQPGPSPDEKRTASCYPTSDEINALPEKFRQYIHDLETRTDKSGDVQAMALLREDRDALQKRVDELEADFRKQNADLRRAVFEDFLRDPSCVFLGVPLPTVRRMLFEYQEAGLKLDATLLEQAKANPFAQKPQEFIKP